eukprot:g3015.t1
MGDNGATDEVDLLDEKDLYKVLGVSRGAQADELKRAYRQKSLRYHPDKNPSPDAKPIFQRITEAYSILSDDKKRLKYDKSGDMDLEDFDIDQFLTLVLERGTQRREAAMQGVPTRGFESATHASFESFMKQVTGLGDPSGEFLMPDGSKAEMSKVPGVPDIRAHMQKRMDKAKVLEQVLEMYRTVAAEEVEDSEAAASSPDEVRMAKAKATPERIAEVLDVTLEEAQRLKDDREELLRQLKMRIDELSAEDEEEELLESMAAFGGGMDGADFGLGGFGPGGLGGLEDAVWNGAGFLKVTGRKRLGAFAAILVERRRRCKGIWTASRVMPPIGMPGGGEAAERGSDWSPVPFQPQRPVGPMDVDYDEEVEDTRPAGRRMKGRGGEDDDRYAGKAGKFERLDDDDDETGAARSIEGWYGDIKNLHLNLDRRTGFVKGYAFIEYENKQEADLAVKSMDGNTLLDHKLEVSWAFAKPGSKKKGRR